MGLAIAAILKGYRLVCTAANKIPKERIALLESYGTEAILCFTGAPAADPRFYFKTAEHLRATRGAFLPYQYYNQASPKSHYRTTGPESGVRPVVESPTG